MIAVRKVCMIGDFAVGKTSLVTRFVHTLFSEKYLLILDGTRRSTLDTARDLQAQVQALLGNPFRC